MRLAPMQGHDRVDAVATAADNQTLRYPTKAVNLLQVSPEIPNEVRYVKNGAGGQWWPAARQLGQIHCGWSKVPGALLKAADLDAIGALPWEQRGNTQDFNALTYLIDRPSQYVWVTFQDGCMWWCTVHDKVTVNPAGAESAERGHFWLTCDRHWSCQSLGGRHLATSDLPGLVTKAAGYRKTVCVPKGSQEILRIIRDEEDVDAAAAVKARKTYEHAIGRLVARLAPKDFELLVDLILLRDGWARVAKLGGSIEGVDVEVQNLSANEVAFVQVKSTADQAVVDDYVQRFDARRARYARMIFAVHTPIGALVAPPAEPIQIWDGKRISELVVRHGLGEWVAAKL